jgi:hypothetical protein
MSRTKKQYHLTPRMLISKLKFIKNVADTRKTIDEVVGFPLNYYLTVWDDGLVLVNPIVVKKI